MKATTTLILGGGFGGLAAAYTLRSLISSEHKIILVDKAPSFHVGAGKTWVMLGDKERSEISRKRSLLLPRGIEFLEDEIVGIDVNRGEVRMKRGTQRGDFIIIALGADLNMSAVPGLMESAYTFYTIEGAARLREILREFSGGQVVLLIPSTPFKCPPAPYEAAMLLQEMFRRRGIQAKTRVMIYTVEPAPMPTAGPEMGVFIREMLKERGIGYHPLKKPARVDPERRTVYFEDGSSASYGLLIAIPRHESPRIVRDAELVNESGWVPVDPKTMTVMRGQPSIPVFAVGDVTTVSLPGRYKPEMPLVLPKAGVFAASQGVIAARQIAGRILNEPVVETFDGKGFCYIETGDGTAVKGEGSFFELPHPVMNRQQPDKAQYQDKVQWVNKWLFGEFAELLK